MGSVGIVAKVNLADTIPSMTPLEQRFVLEYCKETEAPNATKAAIRAGAAKGSAGQVAHKWLKKAEIMAAIQARYEEVAAVAAITPAAVLSRWWAIANADPNELIVNVIDCCRHCYGALHAYQWTEAEYSREVDKAIESGKPPPDGMGGFGFDPHLPPLPTCPECFGNGVERVSVADTRKAKSPLYAGIKKTKDGVQVLMHDPAAALVSISKYLGMAVDRKEISGPGGGAVPIATIAASDLTDDQLAAILGNASES